MILLPSAKCLKRFGWTKSLDTITNKEDLVPYQFWAIRNVMIGRTEYLLLFESTTLYTIVLSGIEKKGIEGKILESIREELKLLNVSPDIIISVCDSVEIGKFNSKFLIASINKIEESIYFQFKDTKSIIDLKTLQYACNTFWGKKGEKEYSKPFLRMESLLGRKIPEYREHEILSYERFKSATTIESSYKEFKSLLRDYSVSHNSLRIFFRIFQGIWDAQTNFSLIFPEILRTLNPSLEKGRKLLRILNGMYNNLIITLGKMDSYGVRNDWQGLYELLRNLGDGILRLEKDYKVTTAILMEAGKNILESGDYYHSFKFSKGEAKVMTESDFASLPEEAVPFYVLNLILKDQHLNKNTEEGNLTRKDLFYQCFICAHYLNYRRMVREEIEG
ncbi:hypothetical protein LEP1GSC047_2085 [Leptospira inadai serovar Lyme str. 10]|uniref:DUF6933 domain-containing protein n=2 Tax=Leptospira inadai serovar Lyme TaxID=293084 RepID=V6HEI2_9LEPT|nr:hypothetical protein [Leptospira inadai]EQA38477.1 hypothetical protein LEP1GSC047_2085 [Leptospira inadai serovar Lyme str. 10]PNV71516.1 hypothetical protein BES34_021295 [Leptospira inadai serovar Lyme]